MSLKEILIAMAGKGEAAMLQDGSGEWLAGALLEKLPDSRLRVSAYMQPGLYIAEINEGGYLGRVLYKIKPVAAATE
jgi:hypothetical protein